MEAARATAAAAQAKTEAEGEAARAEMEAARATVEAVAARVVQAAEGTAQAEEARATVAKQLEEARCEAQAVIARRDAAEPWASDAQWAADEMRTSRDMDEETTLQATLSSALVSSAMLCERSALISSAILRR